MLSLGIALRLPTWLNAGNESEWDSERADQRSVFSFYIASGQGLPARLRRRRTGLGGRMRSHEPSFALVLWLEPVYLTLLKAYSTRITFLKLVSVSGYLCSAIP